MPRKAFPAQLRFLFSTPIFKKYAEPAEQVKLIAQRAIAVFWKVAENENGRCLGNSFQPNSVFHFRWILKVC
jgi:hypothetical protein